MIGQRLKEVRLLKGLTQKNVVAILNCSHNKYASWEQNRTEPDIDSLIELCKIFEVSSDYLLGLEDEFGNKIDDDVPPNLQPFPPNFKTVKSKFRYENLTQDDLLKLEEILSKCLY